MSHAAEIGGLDDETRAFDHGLGDKPEDKEIGSRRRSASVLVPEPVAVDAADDADISIANVRLKYRLIQMGANRRS